MFYVIEFQTGSTGAALVNTYDNRPDAEEKYHQILQAAAKSDVPKHGALIINGNLFEIKHELAYREAPEQAAE